MVNRTYRPSNARAVHPAQSQDMARANDEGTHLSVEERVAIARSEYMQESLPSPPRIPGYHVCWLTTSHPVDTIAKRLRIGYSLVTKDEVPGFTVDKTSSGEYGNNVVCNEMILGKLPEELYQALMAEFHHKAPLREEEAINAQIESMAGLDARRTSVIRENGTAEDSIVQRAPIPVFEG